jgi:cytochrome P450
LPDAAALPNFSSMTPEPPVRRESVPLPPGPRAPAAWQLLRYTLAPLPFLHECAHRFGDTFLVRFAGYGRFVMLADPAAVLDVFRGDSHALHSGESNKFLTPTVGPTSVLVLDGEPHALQRRLLLPPLKGERMRSFFDAMQAAALAEIDAWPTDRPVRMLEPMQRITLRVILQEVLGLAPGPTLDDFEGKVERLLGAGRSRYSLILVKVLPLGLLQRARWLPFYRQRHALDTALYALLAERRRRPGSAAGPCVLDDLLAASHPDGKPLTDGEIRDAVVTLLTAGHDTTSIALAWALEQIVPRADVVDALRDELRRVTGGGPPRADQLGRLEYLDAVIRESLRVRTQLPFVVRLTKRPFVAGGREYPPGVVLCPCNHLVHRRPDLYPEPERFRPERFLERKYAGHEWFPFGGGNRTCLGMAFALYEMKVVLGTLFARVGLVRPGGGASVPVRRGIALAPHDGVPLVVTRTLATPGGP